MQLTKKDKMLLGVAGGLLVLALVIFFVFSGGKDKGDKLDTQQFGKRPVMEKPTK